MRNWSDLEGNEKKDLIKNAGLSLRVYMNIKEIVDELGEMYEQQNYKDGYENFLKKYRAAWNIYYAYAAKAFNLEAGFFEEMENMADDSDEIKDIPFFYKDVEFIHKHLGEENFCVNYFKNYAKSRVKISGDKQWFDFFLWFYKDEDAELWENNTGEVRSEIKTK